MVFIFHFQNRLAWPWFASHAVFHGEYRLNVQEERPGSFLGAMTSPQEDVDLLS